MLLSYLLKIEYNDHDVTWLFPSVGPGGGRAPRPSIRGRPWWLGRRPENLGVAASYYTPTVHSRPAGRPPRTCPARQWRIVSEGAEQVPTCMSKKNFNLAITAVYPQTNIFAYVFVVYLKVLGSSIGSVNGLPQVTFTNFIYVKFQLFPNSHGVLALW